MAVGYERVAVVSDVHGNAVAFDAVLSEVLRECPDALLNLGCLTYGPGLGDHWPVEIRAGQAIISG